MARQESNLGTPFKKRWQLTDLLWSRPDVLRRRRSERESSMHRSIPIARWFKSKSSWTENR